VTHFMDHELQQWAASGPGGARAQLVAHLAACPACAARYAKAVRAVQVTTADPASPDEARAFAAVAYDIPVRDRAVVAFPVRRRWIVSLAAAAALIAAIAIPYLATRRAPAGDLVFRGGGLHLLEPVGAVDRASSFGWSSGIPAAAYRLEVGDATGVILTRETNRPAVQLGPEAAQAFKPGVDYWWSVTALDRDGRTLASSPRQAFTVRAR
jgi:hypothetical protein